MTRRLVTLAALLAAALPATAHAATVKPAGFQVHRWHRIAQLAQWDNHVLLHPGARRSWTWCGPGPTGDGVCVLHWWAQHEHAQLWHVEWYVKTGDVEDFDMSVAGPDRVQA